MPETTTRRTIKREENNVVITTEIIEKLTEQEFVKHFLNFNAEIEAYKNEAEQRTAKLSAFDSIEEDETILKLKNQLRAAEDLNKKEKLIKEIKIFEKKYADEKEGLENMSKVYSSITKEMSDK